MTSEVEKKRFEIRKEILFSAIRSRQETLIALSAISAGLLVVATFNERLIPTSNTLRGLVLLLLAIIPFSLIGYLLELKQAEESTVEYFRQFGPTPRGNWYGTLLAYWVWIGLLLIFIAVLWMSLLVSRSFFTTNFLSPFTFKVEWVNAVGTIALGVLALFGPQVRSWIFRPRLMFKAAAPMPQNTGDDVFIVYRLQVTNVGDTRAADVRAVLSSIRDSHGVERQNFIPVPLNWTHVNRATRDISREEPTLLDVAQKSAKYNATFVYWPEGKRPAEETLSRLEDQELCQLRIDFFERNHRLQTAILDLRPSEPSSWKLNT